MRYYALAKKIWYEEDDAWGPPKGILGAVDLSADDGTGYMFVTQDKPFQNVHLPIGDGTRLDSYVMTSTEKAGWAAALGVNPSTTGTLLDALWNLLTTEADPEGIQRAKPIMPTHKRELELRLGGHSLIRSEKLPGTPSKHPAWSKINKVLQNIYKEKRKQDTIHARKWMGAQARKLKLSDEKISQLIDFRKRKKDLPLKPETVVSDNFTRSDEELGASSDWTEVVGDWEVVSNEVQYIGPTGGIQAAARYEQDLSSDDMYSEHTITSNDTTEGSQGGSLCRFNSSANTNYGVSTHQDSPTLIGLRAFKRVSGSRTNLDSDQSVTFNIPETIRIEADGSTIRTYLNGIKKHDFTDTSITGYTRAGLHARQQDAATVTLDNFEAGDLVEDDFDPVIMNYVFV